MKVKARAKKGVAKIKLLVRHPMDTGRVKDPKTGQLIPAHFIQELSCEYKGKIVFTAELGPLVSKDPYLAFAIKGAAAGDVVKLKWIDNQGETDEVETPIS